MKKLLLLLIMPAILLASCGKNDDEPETTIDQTAISLNYDKEHQFVVKQGSTAVTASTLTWTSSDITVGEISTSGLFTAKKIGTTNVQVTANGVVLTSVVTVSPYSTLCKEPILIFGSTKATIKSKETRVLEEESSGLSYTGENSKLRNVYYLFEGTSLNTVVLLFANTNAVLEESATFLAERYTYLGTDDEYLFFSDQNTVVGLSVDDEVGLNAVFLKNTATAKSSMSLKSMTKMVKESRNSTIKMLK